MLTVPGILAQLDDLTAAQCKECIAALKPHLMAAARARDTDTERTIQDCVDKLEARREALLAGTITAPVVPEPVQSPTPPDEPASEPEPQPAPKPRPNLGRGRPRKIQNGKVVEGAQ